MIADLLQVLFLNELEDILELLMDEQLQQVQGPLFTLLAQCLGSQHFQVHTNIYSSYKCTHTNTLISAYMHAYCAICQLVAYSAERSPLCALYQHHALDLYS
jgi:hypothetical protein